MNVIKDGDFVILKSLSSLRLAELQKNKPYYIGKRKAQLHLAVGYRYGTYFEIKPNGTLEERKDPEKDLKVEDDGEIKDNRLLSDSGESQKLTTDDIETLKKQGISGEEMVKKIVENSVSFNEKTAFAKEKYLRKKHKKYVHLIQFLKPNIHWIAEMLYMQGPLKICNLRIDALSQMLTFCNVMSGGRYVVIETVTGLLTAAVLERMGSSGCLVELHLGPFSYHNISNIIKALQVPVETVRNVLHHIDIKNVYASLTDKSDSDEESWGEIAVPKREKREHIRETKKILGNKDMDSLLVAVKNHPSNVLPFLDLLAVSRPFAFFSMFQEPLVDCYVKLKARGDIICLNISETWLRKYQVLPGRTHPDFNMSGSGGFLLTGIKVEPKRNNHQEENCSVTC